LPLLKNNLRPPKVLYLGGRRLFSNNGKPINEFLHAEMDCLNMIRNMDIDFSKVKIYISRKNLLGELACCRPCSACEYAIKELGIKTVYYTDDINKYVREDY
jgi:deoxycytidylate deaminase